MEDNDGASPVCNLSSVTGRHRRNGGIPPHILNLGPRWRWVFIFEPHLLCPWGVVTRYPLNIGYWMLWNKALALPKIKLRFLC